MPLSSTENFHFFYNESMGAMTSRVKIYKPNGFREADFFKLSHFKSMEAGDHQGLANLTPGAWLAGFI